MKKVLGLAIGIAIALSSYSQSTVIHKKFVVHTIEKDTIWFIQNDTQANLLYQTHWTNLSQYKPIQKDDPIHPPVVVFVKEEQFALIVNRIEHKNTK